MDSTATKSDKEVAKCLGTTTFDLSYGETFDHTSTLSKGKCTSHKSESTTSETSVNINRECLPHTVTMAGSDNYSNPGNNPT